MKSTLAIWEGVLLVPDLPKANLLASLVHVAQIEVQMHGDHCLFVYCRFTARSIANAKYARKRLRTTIVVATVFDRLVCVRG